MIQYFVFNGLNGVQEPFGIKERAEERAAEIKKQYIEHHSIKQFIPFGEFRFKSDYMADYKVAYNFMAAKCNIDEYSPDTFKAFPVNMFMFSHKTWNVDEKRGTTAFSWLADNVLNMVFIGNGKVVGHQVRVTPDTWSYLDLNTGAELWSVHFNLDTIIFTSEEGSVKEKWMRASGKNLKVMETLRLNESGWKGDLDTILAYTVQDSDPNYEFKIDYFEDLLIPDDQLPEEVLTKSAEDVKVHNENVRKTADEIIRVSEVEFVPEKKHLIGGVKEVTVKAHHLWK